MNRPRYRWVRSLLVISTFSATIFTLLGIPANAAAPILGTITAGGNGLSIRTGPTTLASRIGTLRTGTTIALACYVPGQAVTGRERSTNRWDRLSDGTYLSDAYVRRSGSVAPCDNSAPAPNNPVYPPIIGGTPVGRWYAPVPYETAQGYRTGERPRHDGEDFMAPRGTAIRAAAAGKS